MRRQERDVLAANDLLVRDSPGIGLWVSGFSPSAAASAPVRTAITPGVAPAAAMSMRPTRACAWGERTKHAYAWPGRLTSSL